MDFFDTIFRHFGKIWLVALVANLIFWAAVIFVAVHFISMWW